MTHFDEALFGFWNNVAMMALAAIWFGAVIYKTVETFQSKLARRSNLLEMTREVPSVEVEDLAA